MGRDYAPIRIDIWADDDWRKLSMPAQHLYMLLLTSPTLNYCGVADWRPARIAALARDWPVEDLLEAAAELAQELFIVVDEGTEEVLIRSFMKHDGLLKQPRMAVSVARAHASIASPSLRGVVVFELRKLRDRQPELPAWTSDELDKVLKRDSVDPSDLPCFGPGFTHGDTHKFPPEVTPGLGESRAFARPARAAPAPAPSPYSVEETMLSPADAVDEQSQEEPREEPQRDDVDDLCQTLSAMLTRLDVKHTIGKTWRREARLLIDKDGRDPEHIKAVIAWVERDQFWSTNIHSMPTLRAQYDKLRLRAEPQQSEQEEFVPAMWRPAR